MHQFWKGFLSGLLAGGLLGWLYRMWTSSEQAPIPAQLPLAEKETPDDLTAIRGIGPSFARRLHQTGIDSYAQLAKLTPEEIADRSGIALWRIQRDDWVGQAAAKVE